MTCEWIPGDAIPACDWNKDCPDHGNGSAPDMTHFGLDSYGGMSHKGTREDCLHPDCAWPREGDLVTAMLDGQERTGELTVHGNPSVIQTPSGTEFEIDQASIRKPDWGAYCPHGLLVMEAVPAEHTCQADRPLRTRSKDDRACPACYPSERVVEPWPCGEQDCTRERFEQAAQEDLDEYCEAMIDLMRTQYE